MPPTAATLAPSQTRPAIHILAEDYDLLADMIGRIITPSPGAALLAQELDRATVVQGRYRGQPFVRLNSIVEYEDLGAGQRRHLRVVMPADANLEDNRVSVLSPAGAALLGLKAGQTMHWEVSDGRTQTFKVLAVLDSPPGA